VSCACPCTRPSRPACPRSPREAPIDPQTALVLIVGFVVAISIHEFSHALAARLLGDHTAERAGRLTLNPLRHLDPFGSLLLLLTMFSGAPGIGWGRPVPVDGRALRWGRAGMAIVSGAGPFSNFLLALATAIGFGIALRAGADLPDLAVEIVQTLIILNIGLCVFNLLPVAPLDGFGVAVGVLPAPLAMPLARLGQYGPGILLILIFSGSILRFNLLGFLLDPPRRALLRVVVSAAGAI
jgi:Zn-dependent protease